jgi:hypothetical protein
MAFEQKPLASPGNEEAVSRFVERLKDLELQKDDLDKLAKAYNNSLNQLADLNQRGINNKKLVFDAIANFYNTVRSSKSLMAFGDAATIFQIYREFIGVDRLKPYLSEIQEDLGNVDQQLPSAIQKRVSEKLPLFDSLILDPITKEVAAVIEPNKKEIVKFWREFLGPLNIGRTLPPEQLNIQRTSLPVQRSDNYILQEILTDPKIGKLLDPKKYQVLFNEDSALKPLLEKLKSNFAAIAVNNPASLQNLFTPLNQLDKKVQTYCKVLNEKPTQNDIVECYQALGSSLSSLGIEQFDLLNKVDVLAHIYNANQRIAIRNSDISETMDLIKSQLEHDVTANPREFLGLNPESEIIGDYLKPEDVHARVRSRASNSNVNLLNAVRAFSSAPTIGSLEEHILALRQRDTAERDRAYFSATTALGTDSGLKTELSTQLQKILSQSALQQNTVTPQVLPDTFDGLRAFIAGEKASARVAPITDQARFLHQVGTIRYTLSGRELELLSTATGMKLNSLKPANYQDAINQIRTEIERREELNRGWFGLRGMFFPERTAHLRAAGAYIAFNQEKRFAAVEPEQRLLMNLQRAEIGSTRTALSSFESIANSLSSVFSTNRAIKELNTVAHQKATQANKLKKDYSSYWKEESRKETKHAELREKVTSKEGRFYQPERIAAHNFVSEQDFVYRNHTTRNYLISNKQEEQKATQTNTFIELKNLDTVRNLSLMEITQGVYKTISDIMAKLQETESYSKPPKDLDLSEQQLSDIGEHLQKAKTTHKELKQAISTFSQLLLAMKQFHREAATILEKIDGKNNTYVIKDLKFQLERLDNLYEEPSRDGIKNRSPKFIGYIKNNELKKLISTILDEIEARPDANVIGQVRQDLEGTERNIDNLSKKFFNRAQLQKIVDVSTKNIEALTYISDHATAAFKKSDEPRP